MHKFEVKAKNRNGNIDPTTASYQWTIDMTTPFTKINSTPANPSGSGIRVIEFSCNEVSCTFDCQLDNGDWNVCVSPKKYSGLINGSHTFSVRAKDSAGNIDPTPEIYTWTINDTTPPDTIITSHPINPCNSSTAKFEFTSTEEGSVFECQLDNGGWSICTSPMEYLVLSDGYHTFEVRAKDISGNVDPTPASYTWAIDTIPPDTIITSTPSNPSISSSATFTFVSDEDGSTFECRTDKGSFSSCTSPQTYLNLLDGSHTFEVRARDIAGNTDPTPASYTWTVDIKTLSIAAGGEHTCAVLSDNTIKCWGWNGYGQLGNGSNSNSNLPVHVSGINNAVSVAAGDRHTCALLSDSTIKCWGWLNDSNIPIQVKGINNAISVAAGGEHTCAVLSDRTIKCWGHNDFGQLGNGSNNDSNLPVQVIGIDNAISVAAGYIHTCALLSDGKIKCWGYNDYGQLGNGSNGSGSNLPVQVIGIDNAISVAAGNYHTCAVLSDRTIKCWGHNNFGQLGNGSNNDSNLPVQVIGIDNAVNVSARHWQTCAILSDGTIKCWGNNEYGKLGNGSNNDSNIPVYVSGINNAVSVSAGYRHTCAVLSDGSIKCWGWNWGGQLGNGRNSDSNLPVYVSGINNAVSVAAGGKHTCALLSDKTIKCWGMNDYGQLGNGTNDNSNVPVVVSGITNAVSVSAGEEYTCALLSDKTIKCWGGNTKSNIPVYVSGINNAVSVSAGYYHTCALLSDKTIKCWGMNDYGQLGNGSNSNSNIPVYVNGINNAVSVSAGYKHTCAVLSDNTIKCWGWIYNDSNVPVSVIGL